MEFVRGFWMLPDRAEVGLLKTVNYISCGVCFVNLDLRINEISFAVGEGFESQKLVSANCHKCGFLARLQLRAPHGEIVYWAKNCEISCFGGEFGLWAELDRKSGADRMVGTSAYLYFKTFAS
jgi:hypothetical protein